MGSRQSEGSEKTPQKILDNDVDPLSSKVPSPPPKTKTREPLIFRAAQP